MSTKSDKNEEEEEGQDAAKVVFAKEAYRTPPERMSEMTILSRKEIYVFALQEMFEAVLDENREPGTLGGVFRAALYRLRRSQDGEHLIGARTLAETQIAGEVDEDIGETYDE